MAEDQNKAEQKPEKGNGHPEQKPEKGNGHPEQKPNGENKGQSDAQVKRRKILGRIIGIVIMVFTVLIVLVVTQDVIHNPRTQDATVGAHYIGMAPEVSGRVVALYAHDNGCVQKGQLLAEVEPQQYQYNLMRAFADQRTLEEEIVEQRRAIVASTNQVAASLANLEDSKLNVQSGSNNVGEATSDVAMATANLTSASEQYKLADITLKRNEPLAAHQYISREEFDQYVTSRDTAKQRLEASEAQLKVAESNVKNANVKHEQSEVNVYRSAAVLKKDVYSVPILSTLLAERPARQASVDKARLDLSHTQIKAPFTGCIVALSSSEGAYAAPGSALFTLINQDSWYVTLITGKLNYNMFGSA